MYVAGAPANIAATSRQHHLLMNRMPCSKAHPCANHYCLPLLKPRRTAGHWVQRNWRRPKFLSGTDSAPHARRDTHSLAGARRPGPGDGPPVPIIHVTRPMRYASVAGAAAGLARRRRRQALTFARRVARSV